MRFRTGVNNSQSHLSGVCHGFTSYDHLVVILVVRFSPFFVFLVTLVKRPAAFPFSRLSAVPVIELFASRLFGGVGHMTDTLVLFFWPHACVIQPVGLCRVGLLVCWFSSIVLLSAYPSHCFRRLFQLSSDQSIRFLWLQFDSGDDMASPSLSPFRSAPVAFPTLWSSSVAATAAVPTSPILATELPPKADVGTSSAQAIVASPI